MKRISSATVTSTGTNYVHRIRAGHFDLLADESQALGGQGAGPAPFDLYLASLAACTAITLRMYAQRKDWNLGEFRAELELSLDEAQKVRVRRLLRSDQPLSDEQWQRLFEIAARTPVTRAMSEGASITSERGV